MGKIISPHIVENLFLGHAQLLFEKAEPTNSEELLDLLKKQRRLIVYSTGAYGWYSDPKARPTPKTVNTLDHKFAESDLARYLNIFEGLKIAKGGLKSIEVVGGEGQNRFLIKCVFPEKLAEMALGYSKIMRPPSPEERKEIKKIFYQIMAPGYEIEVAQAIKNGVNLMQGGNYIGMPKKSGFTLWLDYVNNVLGGFGMHGGFKKITLKTSGGKEKNYAIIIIGDSGHGKSTLSFSDYGISDLTTLFGGDDMVAIIPNGNGFRVVGLETLGLYLKVVGISALNEPFTYEGAMGSDVILENVPTDNKGNPRFETESKAILGTTNHRAVVPLRHFTRGFPPALDIELDDNTELLIMLLTRAPEHPGIVMHENPEYATAFFGALPSEVTSAIKADAVEGETRLTCGADEFTPGPKSDKLLRLYEVLKKLGPKAKVISVNTGKWYKLEETEILIKLFLEENIEWGELKAFPGRKFAKDSRMKFDDRFCSHFGELSVRQKAKLREIGATKEVIEVL